MNRSKLEQRRRPPWRLFCLLRGTNYNLFTMQPTLTFQLDGPTGNLQILKSGLLIAELSIDDQVQLLIQVAHAHTVRQDHMRVNHAPPQPYPGTLTPQHVQDARPILHAITDPTA